MKAGLAVEYLGEHPDEYWSAFPKLDDWEKSKKNYNKKAIIEMRSSLWR